MLQKSADYIPPEQWDDGIPAAFVDYNLTGSTTNIDNIHDNSSYLSLRSGINSGRGVYAITPRLNMVIPITGSLREHPSSGPLRR